MELKAIGKVRIGKFTEQYIQSKVEHLKKMAGRFWNPATKVMVEFIETHAGSPSEAVDCRMEINLPKQIIFAEAKGRNAMNAVDFVEERMRRQIETYKGKKMRKYVDKDLVASVPTNEWSELMDE